MTKNQMARLAVVVVLLSAYSYLFITYGMNIILLFFIPPLVGFWFLTKNGSTNWTFISGSAFLVTALIGVIAPYLLSKNGDGQVGFLYVGLLIIQLIILSMLFAHKLSNAGKTTSLRAFWIIVGLLILFALIRPF